MIKNKTNGFTLLELMAVLVIVGLIAGLALPRFFRTLTNVELKVATREIVSLLTQSSDQAYFKKVRVKASLDMDTKKITVLKYQRKVRDNENGSFVSFKMEWVKIDELFLSQNIKIKKCERNDREVSDGLFEIVFSPAGSSSGGSITIINNREKEFSIDVDFITGTAKIRK